MWSVSTSGQRYQRVPDLQGHCCSEHVFCHHHKQLQQRPIHPCPAPLDAWLVCSAGSLQQHVSVLSAVCGQCQHYCRHQVNGICRYLINRGIVAPSTLSPISRSSSCCSKYTEALLQLQMLLALLYKNIQLLWWCWLHIRSKTKVMPAMCHGAVHGDRN